MSDTEIVVAVHSIEYSHGGAAKEAKPGSPFPCPATEVEKLKRLGAIRDLSEAEQALYEKQNPVKAVAVESSGDGDAAPVKTGKRAAVKDESPI